MDTVQQIIDANKDDYDFGFRFMENSPMENSPAVGDMLPRSNVWEGDEPTDVELPGTCAWDTLSSAEKYAQYSHEYIVLIGGVLVQSGDLAGEIIIDDAQVFAVWKWR